MASAEAPIRWAAEQARRRRLPLTLVHAWREPVTLTLALDPDDVPDLAQAATTHAEPGRPADVVLAQPAELLVLGGHAGMPHLRRVTRVCVERAQCPVAVVPDCAPDRPERLVVGIDYGPADDAAVAWAATTARILQSSVLAVHAWQWHPRSAADALHRRQSLARQQEWEQERLTRYVGAASAAVQCIVVHGAPLDSLLALARTTDLLVVGRRTSHSLGRVVHGAVGEDLSALLPCPVVVVPSEATRSVVAQGPRR